MKINIIARDNGAGLSADINILRDLFLSQGWDVDLTDYKSMKRFAFWSYNAYDLNVFLQWADPKWLKLARKNILIPNPEWFKNKWFPSLNRFDGIFCKTRHAVDIFKKKNPNTVFTSFTSVDHSLKGVPQKKDHYLHLAGKSKMKGTDTVVKTWMKNPDFPHLTVVKRHGDYPADNSKNLTIIPEYMSSDRLKKLMNQCAVHLCPSMAEGFGHSIAESLSCGALVISTDAPPMNELVNADPRMLVPPVRKERKQLTYAYHIDISGLEKAVKYTRSIAKSDHGVLLRDKAYDFYLRNDSYFKKTIVKAIRDLQKNSQDDPALFETR